METITVRLTRLQQERKQAERHPDTEIRRAVLAAIDDRIAAVKRIDATMFKEIES